MDTGAVGRSLPADDGRTPYNARPTSVAAAETAAATSIHFQFCHLVTMRQIRYASKYNQLSFAEEEYGLHSVCSFIYTLRACQKYETQWRRPALEIK